jgi:hypothetical protein
MNQPFMSFNKQSAEKSGTSGAFESGAFVGLMSAKYQVAKTNSKGFELSLHGDTDIDYINIWYEREDGTELRGGMGHINAMMAVLRQNNISIQTMNDGAGGQIDVIAEFESKPMGMVLQRKNYVNQSGNLSYKVELVMVFDPKTRQTAEELINNKPATKVDKVLETLADVDEAGVAEFLASQNGHNAATDAGRPQTKFDQVPAGTGFQPQQNTAGFQRQQNQQAAEPNMADSDEDFFNS